MAEAQKSLLKSSTSIQTIQGSLNSFGKSLRSANSTSSGIIKQLYQGNRDKKSAMLKQSELFQKRRDAVQKREREDVVEAGKVNSLSSAYRRSSKVIGGSTKGFLGRVMDFVGTLMLGWLINNLPRIIKMAKELSERIQSLINILSSWTDSIGNFFGGFTSELGALLSNMMGFDFDSDRRDLEKSTQKMENGGNSIVRDMENMITNLLNFDLFKELGLKSEEGQIDPSAPPGPGAPGAEGEQAAPGSYPSGVYNAKKLAQLARSVGMPEDKIPTMVAIALAESGGKTDAHNPVPPDDSYGLWQINMIGRLGPARRKEYGLKSNDELKDPVKNAKAALAVLKSQGLSAWSVYSSGTYKTHLAAAQKAYREVKSEPVRKAQRAPVIDKNVSYRKGQDVSSLVGASARISSVRGARESFRSKAHGGLDIACDPGLYISLRGVDAEVVATQSGGGYGNVIDIWIPSLGVQLRFAHNTRILIKSGKIPAGTSFAVTGYTGNVRPKGPNGSHIHLEADTRKGSGTYGGNTSPNPYVSLIRLTSTQIEGVKTAAPVQISGKSEATVEKVTSTSSVAESVTPERRGQTIPVPIPTATTSDVPQETYGPGGSASSAGSGNTLNSFVIQTLLRELEYT